MLPIFAVALLAGCAAGATKPPVRPATSVTPCMPGPPLAAKDLYAALEPYAWSLYLREDEPAPPPTTYGTCRVERNKVSAADGTPVAELGCGVRILVPGIVDELGLQVGARGQDVLDRAPKPLRPMTCMGNGPEQVRCMFERREDQDTDGTWYVVAGSISEDVLTGRAARSYFAARRVVEIEFSVWCH